MPTETAKEFAERYKRGKAIENSKEWPKVVKARFIEPGLVFYEEMGTILLQRPAIDKMAPTFIGKPIVDERHLPPEKAKPDYFEEVADGVVFRVWTEADGWDWCEFLVWDNETLQHCRSGEYYVSCTYVPTEVNEAGGTHNNIAYDAEFLNGEYTHLAIVREPRYEGAAIIANNSIGGRMLKWFKGKVADNEVDPLKAHYKGVPLHDLVASYENEQKEKEDAENGLPDDAEIEIKGKKIPVKNLIEAHERMNAKKNAKNSEGEKGEKAGDQDKAIADEKKQGEKFDNENIEDEEKKLREEKEGKLDAAKDNALPKKEKENHMDNFAEHYEMRNENAGVPTIRTQADRLKLGSERYGKKKSEVK